MKTVFILDYKQDSDVPHKGNQIHRTKRKPNPDVHLFKARNSQQEEIGGVDRGIIWGEHPLSVILELQRKQVIKYLKSQTTSIKRIQ